MKELEYPFDKAYIQSKRRSIKKTLLSSDTFISKRIAILGGSTTAAIKDMLELFLLNQGIKPEFYESEYNKFYEDAVFSNPELEEFKPEIVYVCTSVRNLITWPSLTDSSESVNAKLQAEIEKYITIWEALQQRFGCMIIQNNFDPPQYRLMGNFDAVSPNGATNYVMRLNLALSEEVGKRPYLNLLDLNYVASDYGLTKWQDEVAWCSFKYAMNLDAVPDLAFNVAKIIKSALGKNKKALVLDLDNTLWGGVIGDDGVDGIELGQELPMGQAYQAFQHYVKKQTELGVVLAIDSKNDEENALAGLNHQDSVLKKEDFACIKANWQPKDVNLSEIARELSLGPDSFVFCDDNPAERLIVEENIGACAPGIGSVTDYIKVLDHSGFFEVLSLNEDDRKRNEMYKENAKRSELAVKFADYGEYLKALEMKAEIKPFDAVSMARIAQLTNKSNQFNLTTKRFTAEELQTILEEDDCISLYGRLSDCFGDNGIVSVVLGKIQDDSCHIDLWLMSCRVLKRDMEQAIMDEFIARCQEKGIKTIIGTYIPTPKNAMVKDFYKDMGFDFVSEENGTTVWSLDVTKDIPKKNKYIQTGEFYE